MCLDNFFKGGFISNQRKKEYRDADLLARLLTSKHYVDLDGFIRVNHKHLGPAYQRVVQRLEDSGHLEVSHDFIIGERPNGYKPNMDLINLDKVKDVLIEFEDDTDCKEEDVYLYDGSQWLSLESFSFDDSIKDCLNLDFFRDMVAQRMQPIGIKDDYIITPAGAKRSFLFNFLNRSGHLVEDKRRPHNAAMISDYVFRGEVFFYENSQGKKFYVIGDPSEFLEATAKVLLQQAMGLYLKVEAKKWYAYMKTSNRREYHTLTNMPRWMRKFLRCNGNPIGGADMRNAQPVAWATMTLESMERGEFEPWEETNLKGVQDYSVRIKLLREAQMLGKEDKNGTYLQLDQHPDNTGFQEGITLASELRRRFRIEEIKNQLQSLNHIEGLDKLLDEEAGRTGLYVEGVLAVIIPKDLKLFIKAATQGYFYEELARLAGLSSRDEAKQPTLKVAYDVIKNDPLSRKFQKAFPTVKRWIDERKMAVGNKQFARDVQAYEADGWRPARDVLYFEHGIAYDSVHDEVMCDINHLGKAVEVLKVELFKKFWLGFELKVKDYSNGE